MAGASMTRFQPKPEAVPPDSGDGPDDPPPPPPADSPETAPMAATKPRDRNAEVDFRGQKRSNATHAPGRPRHDPPPFTGIDPAADAGRRQGLRLRRTCAGPVSGRMWRRRARYSADGRTTRHPGYAVSQKRRKKIEEPFGCAKTVGPMAQTMLRGVKRVGAQFPLTMAACNLARLPRLLAA